MSIEYEKKCTYIYSTKLNDYLKTVSKVRQPNILLKEVVRSLSVESTQYNTVVHLEPGYLLAENSHTKQYLYLQMSL